MPASGRAHKWGIEMLKRYAVLRRQLRDRGVVAVEAALVTPILLLIIVAIVEFGLVYKDQLAVTSAVRAGARMASAEPRIATFAQDAADAVAKEGSALDLSQVTALWVFQADSTGHPVGAGGTFDSCATNCVQFKYSDGGFTVASGSWASSSQDACVGEEDSVGVYMRYNHEAVTDVLFRTETLTSSTVMRIEPIPSMQTGGCEAS
ncbi:MAG: pilus assembly protein [Gordonia sp. (in: high G+C Gram-positive bacteria)]